jgi:AbrB family looped-hinge helix DNA binding protein
MRVTSKGQVTIPQEVREWAGFLPNTEVEFIIDGDLVFIVKKGAAAAQAPTRGERALAALRRHRVDITMSTDELMALTRGDV